LQGALTPAQTGSRVRTMCAGQRVLSALRTLWR
jgi:hypothetical protein